MLYAKRNFLLASLTGDRPTATAHRGTAPIFAISSVIILLDARNPELLEF